MMKTLARLAGMLGIMGLLGACGGGVIGYSPDEFGRGAAGGAGTGSTAGEETGAANPAETPKVMIEGRIVLPSTTP